MSETWSFRDIARESGRSVTYVATMAAAGLLPGHSRGARRRRARIQPVTARAYATVLRSGACSRELAELMRDDPAQALAVAEALSMLAQAALTGPSSEQLTLPEEAA